MDRTNGVPTGAAILWVLLLLLPTLVAPGPPLAAAQPAEEAGSFTLLENRAQGVHVSLSFDAGRGYLTEYRLNGTTWISAIQLPGAANVTATGDRLRLAGEGFEVVLRDHPSGLARFRSEADVRLTPSGLVRAQQDGADVLITGGNDRMLLSPAQRSGFTVTVRDATLARLGPAASGLPVGPEAQALASAVEAAVRAGRLAARVEIHPDRTVTLNYQELPVDIRTLQEGRWRFVVAGSPEPHALLVGVAPGIVDPEKVTVRYFEQVLGVLAPADMQRASSLEDALDPRPGEPPEYHVLASGGGVHVAVSLPGRSTEGFEVSGSPPAVTPHVLFGLIVGLLFVVIAAVLLMAGRRRSL